VNIKSDINQKIKGDCGDDIGLVIEKIEIYDAKIKDFIDDKVTVTI